MLLSRLVGRTPVILRGDVLQRVLEETIALYRSDDDLKIFLEEIDEGYPVNSK